MKLVDLKPRWINEPGQTGQGMVFLCPHCLKTQIAVVFTNPLDGGEVLPQFGGPGLMRCLDAIWDGHRGEDIVPPGFHWQRTGDTFDVMSLSPSVDCSGSGHWHGFLKNGSVQ